MSDSGIILEAIKALRGDQKDHRDEMLEHQRETIEWHAKAESRLENIEDDLREHKEGVVQNRANILGVEKRTTELERPITFKTIAKNVGMIGVIISCMLGALKLATFLKL